jgi:hypothetical protein
MKRIALTATSIIIGLRTGFRRTGHASGESRAKLLATLLALALLPAGTALADEAGEYASQAHITRERAESNLLTQAAHPNPVAEYGRNVWFDAASSSFRTDHDPASRGVVRATAMDMGGGSTITQGSSVCTLGFFGHETGGPPHENFRMTTAGHCTRNGGTWYSEKACRTTACEGPPCPTSSADGVVEAAADVGSVGFNEIGCSFFGYQHTWGNPWERERPYHFPEWKPFKINPTTGALELWIEVGPETDLVIHEDPPPYTGEFVCKYGAAVPHSCGAVGETNRTTEINYGTPLGKINVQHTFTLCALAEPGDSGGPIEQRLMSSWSPPWEGGGNSLHARGVGYTIAAEAKESCNTIGQELAPALAREGLEPPPF